MLKAFADLAEQRGDAARAAWCRERAEALRAALEEHAWDGGWYRRAYFDDGTPLGSAQNDECQIDALAAGLGGDLRRRRPGAGPAGDGRGRASVWCARRQADPALRPALRPGGARSRATSRATCRASARTAASTRTPPPGSCWRRRCRAAATGRWSCGTCSTRSATPPRRRRWSTTRSSRTSSAADVYGAPPHTGRGGWTWYTGSASWLYRVALEAILGFRLAGDRLRFEPCVPPSWPGYEITYRYRSATYRVRVENPAGTGRGVRSVTVDEQPVPGGIVPLRDDGRTHDVRVTLG